MGTSRPKPDAPPAAPLIPPWADEDPTPPLPLPEPLPEDPVPELEDDPGPPADEVIDGEDDVEIEVAEPRRYAPFRTALRRFAGSGDRTDARTALARWATRSVGGGAAGLAGRQEQHVPVAPHLPGWLALVPDKDLRQARLIFVLLLVSPWRQRSVPSSTHSCHLEFLMKWLRGLRWNRLSRLPSAEWIHLIQ